MQIRVVIEPDEELGGYSATCPELNYVSSCGETVDEAVENLREAITLLLRPIPREHLAIRGDNVEFLEMAV